MGQMHTLACLCANKGHTVSAHITLATWHRNIVSEGAPCAMYLKNMKCIIATQIACTDILLQQREDNNELKFDSYVHVYMDNLWYYNNYMLF